MLTFVHHLHAKTTALVMIISIFSIILLVHAQMDTLDQHAKQVSAFISEKAINVDILLCLRQVPTKIF